MKKLCFLFFLFLPLSLLAQRKVTAPAAIWPELQVNYGVGEGGLFFFRNQYRINTDSRFNDLRASGFFSSFERVELSLGYEHEFTDHWRGGALLRYAAEDFPKMLFYTLFMRHTGHISSLYLNKQLMFEYVEPSFGRFRWMAELGRRFPVRNDFLTPAISYEAALFSDFRKDDNNSSQERLVDRTQLKINFHYEVSERLRVNPYYVRQTAYYYILVPPVYNELGQLEKEGYTTKRNRISPIVGLELKYTLNRPANTASITY